MHGQFSLKTKSWSLCVFSMDRLGSVSLSEAAKGKKGKEQIGKEDFGQEMSFNTKKTFVLVRYLL